VAAKLTGDLLFNKFHNPPFQTIIYSRAGGALNCLIVELLTATLTAYNGYGAEAFANRLAEIKKIPGAP